jgi:antitoxin HicB
MTSATDSDISAAVRALLARPYRRVVQGDAGDGFLAYVPELPGCMTAAGTAAEALEALDEAMALWFETALEEGQPVPDPAPAPTADAAAEWSGKMSLRMPKSLHRDLALQAQRDEVSINQLAVTLIARGLARM